MVRNRATAAEFLPGLVEATEFIITCLPVVTGSIASSDGRGSRYPCKDDIRIDVDRNECFQRKGNFQDGGTGPLSWCEPAGGPML